MKYVLAAIIAFTFTLTANAQFGGPMMYIGGGGIVFSKATIIKGDPLVLAGKKIQVTIIFDSVEVQDYDTEKKLVEDMTSYYERKGAGRGQIWADNWRLNKTVKFKELFIAKFNQMGKESETSAQPDSAGADYHLIITTSFLSIGYNAGIEKDPARINTKCDFRDKNGQSVVIVAMENVPGQTVGKGDYDISNRVAQCYQKLGKDLYRMIEKRLTE
jgi:hypothetical protein